LIDAILHKLPARPRELNPNISSRLQEVILKCLEKDSTKRYQNVKELLSDLRQLVTPGRVSSRRLAVAASVLVVVVAAITMVWRGWLSRTTASSKPEIKSWQITSNPDNNPVVATAISPDGKYLAFTDAVGLHLRAVATGESHTLPVPNELCFR